MEIEQLFPEELQEDGARWLFWQPTEDGRKIPRNPKWGQSNNYTGYTETPKTDPRSWFTYDQASRWNEFTDGDLRLAYYVAKEGYAGLDDHEDVDEGDLPDEPNFGIIDFDDARDPETGDIHPTVEEWIAEYDHIWWDISPSGTGVHALCDYTLPDRFTEPVIELESTETFPNAEVEIYPGNHYITMTGKHIAGTGTKASADGQGLLDNELLPMAEEQGEASDADVGGVDFDDHEPTFTKDEVGDVETTGDIQVIYDAIAHVGLRDIRLLSEKTEDRGDDSKSFDPSWESSKSGTRLGYEDGGFIYRRGMDGLDILQVVALEERIITSVHDYPEGEDFWEAVDALRRRGADIPEYDPEKGQKMSILPLERLDALSHEERVRYANKRGIEWPDVEEVHDRLRDAVCETMTDRDKAVIASPTGSGKTHLGATTDWLAMGETTNEKPVIHAHKTREARDGAAEMSEDAGVEYKVLKGRTELCPLAAGQYDPDNSHGNEPIYIDGVPVSEWIDHRCKRQGLPFSIVHGWVEQEVERQLPCEAGDTQCASKGQFEDVPRDDEGNPNFDVIHCTHQFLNVPSLRMHTNILLDEKPAFGTDLTPQQVRESVNEYLKYVDAPVNSYSELVYAAENGSPPGVGPGDVIEGVMYGEWVRGFEERMDVALNGEDEYVECPTCDGEGVIHQDERYQDVTAYPEHGGAEASDKCGKCHGTGDVLKKRGRPPLRWFKKNQKAHALAPAFTRAIWEAEESSAGRKSARTYYKPPRFDNNAHDAQGWNRMQVDVVLDEQWEVVDVESVPDFSLTSSVIGLDAHPQPEDPVWQANVSPQMSTREILDTQERSLYRRYERGLHTVQVGEGVQPVTTGEWLDAGQGEKFNVITQHLRDQYGEEFDAAITSMSAKSHIRDAMIDAGIEDPDMMHYGNEESRNDFAGKNVGLVAGSIDPGDMPVINLCARLDLDVEIPYKECPGCDGTGVDDSDDSDVDMCEHCTGTGEVRERGRTFEGEDAEKAKSVLKGVREHHVAQSAGRWARDARDEDDHATVFIITEAAPTGFIDTQVPGATWVTNNDQRERLEYVRDNADGVTAKEVAEATGCSKRAALRTLRKAYENGLLERTPGVGPYGADVYAPDAMVSPDGTVDLSSGTKTQPRRKAYEDNNTWTVAVDSLPHVAYNTDEAEEADWEHQSTFDWFDPPDLPS